MIIKRLSLIVLTIFLTISLLALVLSLSAQRVIGSPETVRHLLKESDVYGALIPEQLIKAGEANPSFAGVPLHDPDIQRVIAQSFKEDAVEDSGDEVTGSLLDWLSGESSSLNFSTTLSPDREQLATEIGRLTEKKVAALPECTTNEEVLAAAERPFEANCAPVWLQPEAAGDFMEKRVRDNAASVQDITLTDENIRLAGGTTLEQQLEGAPIWYQRLQYVPAVFGVLSALFMVILLLLGKFRSGLRAVAAALTLAGGISLLSAGLARPSTISDPILLSIRTASTALQAALDRLAEQAYVIIQQQIFLYGGILLGIGIFILVVQAIAGRKGRGSTPG